MGVYVDKLRNWGWRLGPSCHLMADSNEELHAFAAKLGLKRSWFQRSTSGPHYDLTASKRAVAVKLGAREIDDKTMVRMMRQWTEDAVVAIEAAPTEADKDAIRKHLYR